jgi:HAE1 family hydrophobic/amphiphilic exporter-1
MDDKKIREKSIKINIFGKIAKFFIEQFQLTILLILLIVSLGISGLNSLPKESLPEIVFPAITIQTIFPGASPEDVESLVTEKIENKIKDFDDIDSIESETSFGFSLVTVTYIESVDINQKKIELDNALREVQFADGVSDPEAFIFTTSEIPLMNISVAGDYDLSQLTAIAEEIRDEVEGVRGVDSVTINGTVDREIEVVLNELKMMKLGVDFNQVQNAISSKNFSVPLGELSLNGVRYNLRVDERYDTTNDIENTFIKDNVYIKDVAEIVDGLAPVDSYNKTYIRNLNEKSLPSLFLTVNRKVNSDVIGTSDSIKNLLEEGNGSFYPDDVTVYVSNDLAQTVQADLDNIQSSAGSGLLVVIIVLFLFIGIKESLIVAITIPLSLLGTLGLLSVFGITFNTFAILGLIVALGLLVDNAIIVMENIDRLRKKGLNIKDAAYYGTNQVGYPVMAATMTTISAFFPLAILPGILGAFVSTIPITIIITLSVSLLVSIIITPSLSTKILNFRKRKSDIAQSKEKKSSRIAKVSASTLAVAILSYIAFRDIENNSLTIVMVCLYTSLIFLKTMFVTEKGLEETQLTESYSNLVKWIVLKKRRSLSVLLIGIVILAASFSTFGSGLLKISFFPVNEPDSLTVNIDTVGGLTLDQTAEIVAELENHLYEVESITQFNSTIGGNEIDSATISIELDTSKRSGFDIRNQVEEITSKIPGAIFSIEGRAAGPPVGKPIEIRILGDDLEKTNIFAREVYEYLATIDGAYNVVSSTSTGVPQILVDINENKALSYNLTNVQISSQLRAQINGLKASTIRNGDEEIDIMLRRDLTMIDQIEQVENLFIATPSGNMITLSSLSDIESGSGISNISRKDGERVITISSDLKENYNASEIVDILSEKYSDDAIPEGISIKYSGDVEGIEENFGNLFQSMILAVFLVFIILTLQFKSIGQPFIILATLPMAFIGVIWGLVITGNEFGFYAFMGLIALIGIAVNDAIVLIDYINFLRSQGKDLADAIKEAGKTRFNPVLATTFTTISGVLPLAFKEAYYAQFSFALIFGLMVTTILTLIFIPTIYGLFSKKIQKKVL